MAAKTEDKVEKSKDGAKKRIPRQKYKNSLHKTAGIELPGIWINKLDKGYLAKYGKPVQN